MRLLRSFAALLALALMTATALAKDAPSPQELCDDAQPAALTPMQFEKAEQVLAAGADYRAIFCASAGAVYVDLYESLTPITVNNFVFLARQAYYDNTTFHRVIPDFMAQGGDQTGSGRGGPGYRFIDEPVGFLTFDRPGLLAMANAGPGTNGSQFFITTALTPHLNHKHTIFGDVLVGQDIVEAIRERDPSTATEAGETLQTVLIITDPAEVDNSGVIALEPATQQQVVATFEAFSSSMPPSLPANEETSGLFSSEQIAESLLADLQDDFADFAEKYRHQYRVSVDLENAACETSIYFSSLGYQVDIFADAAAAKAALADDTTRRLLASQGYQHEASSSATYSRDLPTCANEDGLETLSLYTYGRYLVSINVLVAKQILAQAGLTGRAVLEDLALQIEPGFGTIYRPEIR